MKEGSLFWVVYGGRENVEKTESQYWVLLLLMLVWHG